MPPAPLFIIIIGALIILSRGPLLVAPRATLDLYRKLVATRTRVRLFGLVLMALGAAMFYYCHGGHNAPELIIQILGAFIATMAFFLMLIMPWLYMLIAQSIIDAMDEVMARLFGLVSVIAGAIIIYLGISLS